MGFESLEAFNKSKEHEVEELRDLGEGIKDVLNDFDQYFRPYALVSTAQAPVFNPNDLFHAFEAKTSEYQDTLEQYSAEDMQLEHWLMTFRDNTATLKSIIKELIVRGKLNEDSTEQWEQVYVAYNALLKDMESVIHGDGKPDPTPLEERLN